MFSLWYGHRQGNHCENLLSYKGIEREGYLSSWLVGGRRATKGAVTTAVRKEGLHLQAGILGKAVGSYLLCRSRAALWLPWAILGIASQPFGQDF